MSRHHDSSRRYHDRVARQYDSIYDDPYWDLHDQYTWKLIKPYLPTDLSAACADLGCGTGKWGLKLLKTGFAVTFVDSSAGMIGRTREKLESLGSRGKRAALVVADIIDMPDVPSDSFSLVLGMGDPLSICSDPQRACNEMARITSSNGIVIATADNTLAALDHFVERGSLDALEEFVRTRKTRWLTSDESEQFELTTFTPASLTRQFERSGFEVLSVTGKLIIPARSNKRLLQQDRAMDRILKLEADLAKDPAACARAGHLQIVARKP